MADLLIEKTTHMRILVTDLDDGGSIETQSVEANLLYAMLEKLEEIKAQGVNIENALIL